MLFLNINKGKIQARVRFRDERQARGSKETVNINSDK